MTVFKRLNQQGRLALPQREKSQQMVSPDFSISREPWAVKSIKDAKRW